MSVPQAQVVNQQLQALYAHFNSKVAMQTTFPGFTFTKPTGGGTTSPFQISNSGILKGIRLKITGSVAGTLSAPNAFGLSSIVRRVRLVPNVTNIVMDFSGMGYHWVLRDNMDEYYNPEAYIAPGHGGRDPVVPSTFDISMYLPLQINQYEPVGLWMLQNNNVVLNLYVDWEADATVATGATVTATAVPELEIYTIPDDYGDGSLYRPLFSLIHTILEEQESIGATGDYPKKITSLGTFLAVHQAFNHGVYGSDAFTHAQFSVDQTNRPHDLYPEMLDYRYSRNHPGLSRPQGVIPFDFREQSGRASYSNARDLVNSVGLTDIKSIITLPSTATVPVTLYTWRDAVYQAK